ncbi:MAG: hypothetical protein GF334_02080 [Candidatus Altiarchaeales archaeon]|nr:hypothetical protein [Candidatus Altiarchaeales archaeon]
MVCKTKNTIGLILSLSVLITGISLLSSGVDNLISYVCMSVGGSTWIYLCFINEINTVVYGSIKGLMSIKKRGYNKKHLERLCGSLADPLFGRLIKSFMEPYKYDPFRVYLALCIYETENTWGGALFPKVKEILYHKTIEEMPLYISHTFELSFKDSFRPRAVQCPIIAEIAAWRLENDI